MRATAKFIRNLSIKTFAMGVIACCCASSCTELDSTAGRNLPKPINARALSRHYVEVSFPGELSSTAEVAGRYMIADSNGAVLPIESARIMEDGSTVLLTTEAQEEKSYYLMVGESGNLEAGPGGVIDIGDASNSGITFFGSASSEPELLSAVPLTNTSILVLFDNKVEQTSAQNILNYHIDNPDLKVLTAVRGTSPNDNTVVLTTSPQTDQKYTLVVANVKHLTNGLYVDPTADTVEFFGINRTDTTRPRLLTAVATGYEDVVLTFNEPIENFIDDVANYTIVPSLSVLAAIPNEWGTQVTLKIQPLTAGVNYTVTVNNVEDRSFNVIDLVLRTANFMIPANETVPPRVVSAASIDLTHVLITFNEPVSDNAADPTKYSISPLLVVVGAELSEFKTQVLLTTLPQTANLQYTVTVSGITDSVGNPIDQNFDTAMFTYLGVMDPALIALPPRVIGALATSDTTVVVTFNKPMDDSADDPSHYGISGTETAFVYVLDALRSPDGTQVRLETSPQNDDLYTLQVVGVYDIYGNGLAPPEGPFAPVLGLDPGRATFRGIAPSSIDLQIDTDGDGFADWFETAGWEILVGLANGGQKRAFVTSDPYNPDTDGDGFTDGEENAHSWDPRTDDTDADRVDDYSEFNRWFSDPADQDTDNDGIDDETEINFFKTSPILDDTDGDGFTDDMELSELSRNPNVADLPRPNIKATDIRLLINEKYSFQDTEGNTQTTTSSTESTLTQSQETKFSTSDTDVLKVGVEASLEISATPSLTIGGSFGAEWTTQTTNESSQMAQQQYQNSVSRAREISSTRQVTREIVGASVSATVTILNEGDIAFTIGNIEVSALQQGGPGRKQFLPIATLVPAGGNNSFNLGPLIPERGPFIFQNTDVFPNLVDNLLREPRGLVLKVANFDMTDEFGRNFAFTSQEVTDKTSEIRIDFGDGRSESFHVATYGGIDDGGFAGPVDDYVGGFNDLGETAGIPLDFALQDILGLVKNPPANDAVVAGTDGFANTVAAGDDVQEIPPATGGLDDRAIVVSAGANGVLNTVALGGDDQFAKTVGYDTSSTCNELTTERIFEPDNFGNGIADTDALGDDIQVIAVGAPAAAGALVVGPGANGVLDTVRMGDDVRRGPGDPCTMNSQCPGGACDAREVITRIENSVNGNRNRFWIALTSDQIPVGTDVGQVNLQPGFVILLAFIQDVDRDGLPAQEEYVHGSSDTDKDSDDDTLGDFAEVRIGWVVELLAGPYQAYPDPRLPDSDGDGKTDSQEFAARTDPRLNDTDLDGIKDNFELDNVSGVPSFNLVTECTPNGSNNVMLPLEAMMLDPLNPDSDGDGLDDGSEIELGTCPLDRQDGPQFLDSDEDGLTNAEETTPRTISYVNCAGSTINVFNVTTNPLNGDTDFDGLPDALEVGKASLGLPALSNPEDVDTDNDGLLDYDEFANFAFFQYVESEYPGFILDGATSQQIGSNPSDCDSDNDSLTDAFENAGSWGVLAFGDESARTVQSNPLVADSDLDGLTDGQEFRGQDGIGYGMPGDTGDATDPQDPDTDGDDRTDGEEVAFGSNPLRADLGVAIRIVAFGDVDGHSGGGNDWDFYIQARRPITSQVNTMLTDQNFSPNASNACTNYWQAPGDFTSVGPPFNLVQFGLNIGDPVVIEGRWLDVSGCSGSTIIANCTMLFSETFTSEQMASQGFISHDFHLTDNDCIVDFTIEITVN